MIIDAHVHFWNYHPVKDNWITPEMDVIRKDFLPVDLESCFTEHQVEGCVAVQADQSEKETAFLLAEAENNSMIKAVVGWIDLLNPNVEERLNYFSQFPQLKGFRHIAQAEPKGFLLQNEFIEGLKLLHKYNFTYDILLKADQLGDGIRLLERLPDHSFVLDHCCKPDIKGKNIQDWKEQVQILAQNPKLCCKVSGLITEADWNKWNEQEIFNCLDVVFGYFGIDRLLFGSDWPVMLLAGNYPRWLQLLKSYTKQFTETERNNFFSENTKAFYKI
ncbi:amidohydrolase family protein [Pedobacter nototheniae]|uniref:amidohydrolase family protein n=1 Tax=Pedobacter nototheniae TaxID=2488994 RepID=UPI00292FEC5E|nr:amidohydrolase family protein [Pedobacter nototheniae]